MSNKDLKMSEYDFKNSDKSCAITSLLKDSEIDE